MPESRQLPLARWGEELRRRRSADRMQRRHILAASAAAAAVAATIATLLCRTPTRLVWNVSASSPVGLYVVGGAVGPSRGDMVIAWAPGEARSLAAARRYLPESVPMVKQVAAAEGDRVCAAGESVFVNGALAARRLSVDREGRPLPSWTGCFDLGRDRLLLLGPERQDSFDGRYFGISHRKDVIGRARLLWPR